MTRNCALLVSALLLTAIVALVPSGATAGNFVSLNGKFYISYPEDWHQIDFNTVDYYLSQTNATRQTFQYEGVFAPKSDVAFQYGPYLILTVDTAVILDARRVDSVLNELSTGVGKAISRTTSGDPFATLTIATPVYDESSRLAVLLTDVGEPGETPRTCLLAVKFYDRGTANFYFYAPDSVFAQVKPVFQNILNSFSTENLQAAMPKEELKLADADKLKGGSSSGGSKTTRNTVVGSSGAIIVILIATLAARRRRQRQAEQNRLSN